MKGVTICLTFPILPPIANYVHAAGFFLYHHMHGCVCQAQSAHVYTVKEKCRLLHSSSGLLAVLETWRMPHVITEGEVQGDYRCIPNPEQVHPECTLLASLYNFLTRWF